MVFFGIRMGWCSPSHAQSVDAGQWQLWLPESQLLILLPSQTNGIWSSVLPKQCAADNIRFFLNQESLGVLC